MRSIIGHVSARGLLATSAIVAMSLSGQAPAGPAPEIKEDPDPSALLAEIKTQVGGMMTGFEEFKRTNDERLKQVEKKGVADPVTVDKLEKIEKTLATFEPLNQKLVQMEAAQKAAKERNDELELKLGRLRLEGGSPEERAELRRKNFNIFARGAVNAFQLGLANLTEDQRKAIDAAGAEYKAMGITDDTTGGYLAPIEEVREIIKGLTEISPARQLANVRNTANKAVSQPKRTGQFAARRTTDQGTRTETTGLAYGMEEIPAPEMYALVDISQQNLEDSAYDLEAEIRMESEEQFAVREGYEFVNGTGTGEMEGILTNAAIGYTVSGAATAVAFDGLIDLKHAIKSGCTRNSSWVLNRTTLGSVRKLKASTSGDYLWQPRLDIGQPNTIDGDPYVEFPDMPNEGAGLYPVAYGDFKRAYTMVNRLGLVILRDPYTQATSGNIRIIVRGRVGGKVVLAEAIRKLKCST